MGGALIVQPNPGGRISGGYRYNAEMAAHGAWDLLGLQAEDLEKGVDPADHDWVIADSIWLTEWTIAPFLRLRKQGVRVGVLLHSFPSMIAAAESGRAIEAPTAFELEAIEKLGTALLPGPYYAELLGGRADVRVFEPGVDDAWRAPPRPRGDRCTLVSVGAVTPRKGFLDVANALEARPRRDDYRWIVVGSLDVDPAYGRELQRRAEQLETVVLMGQRSPSETREIVQRADLLVMPSYDENHPLVLLEAVAASVPSVAYAAGAAAHILGNGGLVAPVGDEARLGAHLERLIGDEGERYRMAEACWSIQAGLPNWATAARRAKDSLARAAGGPA